MEETFDIIKNTLFKNILLHDIQNKIIALTNVFSMN